MENLREKRETFEIEITGNINFQKIFGNKNPVHLEIGSGRGEFILEKARQNLQINFLGIDSKEKRIKTILRKLKKDINKNIKVAQSFIDAENIKFFPQNSVQQIYLIHPDPWPKRKHFSRRIIQNEFIDLLYKMLTNGGVVEIATDHKEYADWIVEHFFRRDEFVSLFEEGFSRETTKDHVETYFEMMKRAEGFAPYFMKFKKI